MLPSLALPTLGPEAASPRGGLGRAQGSGRAVSRSRVEETVAVRDKESQMAMSALALGRRVKKNERQIIPGKHTQEHGLGVRTVRRG